MECNATSASAVFEKQHLANDLSSPPAWAASLLVRIENLERENLRLIEEQTTVNKYINWGAKDDDKNRFFAIQAQKGDLSTVKYCIKYFKVDINSVDCINCTVLQKALEFEPEPKNVTQFLIEQGAILNHRGTKNPLHIAAEMRHEDILKLLLKHEAKVDLFDGKGVTALHSIFLGKNCLEKSALSCASILLEYGADINIRMVATENTLLDLAVRSCTKYNNRLLDWIFSRKNVELNSVDSNGYSALHKACKANNIYAVRALLQAGANSNLFTNEFLRKKPIELVDSATGKEIFDIFKNHEQKMHSILKNTVEISLETTNKSNSMTYGWGFDLHETL